MPNLFRIASIGKPNVIKLLSRTSGLPVTLAQVKNQLFIPTATTTWDNQLTLLINSAVLYFEKQRQVLIKSTWTGYYNTFPLHSLLIKKAPLISISSIKYYDSDNVQQTVNSSDYYTTVENYYSYIMFNSDFSRPVTYNRPQAVEVEFIVGLCTDDLDCPPDIQQGILMYLSFMWENKGDSANTAKIPSVINELFFPYKVMDITSNSLSIETYRGLFYA